MNIERLDALVERLADDIQSVEYGRVMGEIAEETQSYVEKMALARKLGNRLPEGRLAPVKTIGMFYYRYGNGGIERVVSLLAKQFCESGYRVVVVTHDELNEDSYELPEKAVHELLSPIDSDDPRKSIARRSMELTDIIERNGIDTFIDHAWLSGELIYDLLTCRFCGVRFVMYVHGVFSFPQVEANHTRDYFALCPLVARHCDAVVVQSEINARFYSKFCTNTHVVPNPITDEYDEWARRAENAVDAVGRRLLWVGRFEEMKRPSEAIEILAKVCSVMPDARIDLVGKSEDGQYEAILKNEAENLGVVDKVNFVGYTTDMAHLYREADLLISTTEIEGFCMVLLEASAAGLPIVMYRLPYLPFDKSNGVVSVPIGDVDGAAASVIAILNDEMLYATMRQGSLECYEAFRGYDYDGTWKSIFDSFSNPPESGDCYGQEEMMWDVLLDHYARGSKRLWDTQARLLDENWWAAVETTRAEYDASLSYRLGRALSAIPRRIRGIE